MSFSTAPLRRWKSAPWLAWFLLWSLTASTTTTMVAVAKTVSGDFRLTGATTEHVLSTFAVVPTGGAMIRLSLQAKFMYEDERALAVYLYRDTEWPQFQKAALCSQKMRFSKQRQMITFDYKDKEWKTEELQLILVNQNRIAPAVCICATRKALQSNVPSAL